MLLKDMTIYFQGLIISLVLLTANGTPLSETNFTESAAFDYLAKYGYVNQTQVTFDADSGPGKEYFQERIKDFQDSAGLQITGELDADTIEVMEAPRCGLGVGYDELRVESQKWHKKTLTYRIMKYSRRVNNADVDRTVRRAMDFWEGAADIRFQKTSGRADIEIIFGTRGHGDRQGQPFDGPGGILAHAYFPTRSSIGGDAHFDDDESWSVTNYRGKQLLQTTTHELGHSLGLTHSKVRGSVMYFSYPGWNPRMKLHRDDITRIQRLYGQSRGGSRPTNPINPAGGPRNGACVCQDYTRFEFRAFKTVGNCRTEYRGRKWCYIDSGASCADSQRSSKVNRDWSWEACQTNKPFIGPTVCKEVNVNYPYNDISGGLSLQGSSERCRSHCGSNRICTHWTFRTTDGYCWLKSGITEKTREDGLISGARFCQSGQEEAGNCQCNGVTRYDAKRDETVGHCQTKYRGNNWCYISEASQCGDKKGTKRNEDGKRYWSASACEKQTQFQRETFEIETVPLVFPHEETVAEETVEESMP